MIPDLVVFDLRRRIGLTGDCLPTDQDVYRLAHSLDWTLRVAPADVTLPFSSFREPNECVIWFPQEYTYSQAAEAILTVIMDLHSKRDDVDGALRLTSVRQYSVVGVSWSSHQTSCYVSSHLHAHDMERDQEFVEKALIAWHLPAELMFSRRTDEQIAEITGFSVSEVQQRRGWLPKLTPPPSWTRLIPLGAVVWDWSKSWRRRSLVDGATWTSVGPELLTYLGFLPVVVIFAGCHLFWHKPFLKLEGILLSLYAWNLLLYMLTLSVRGWAQASRGLSGASFRFRRSDSTICGVHVLWSILAQAAAIALYLLGK